MYSLYESFSAFFKNIFNAIIFSFFLFVFKIKNKGNSVESVSSNLKEKNKIT